MFRQPAQGHNIGWGVQWTSELIHWAQSTCQVQNNQKKVWEICLRCILLWALHTVDNTNHGTYLCRLLMNLSLFRTWASILWTHWNFRSSILSNRNHIYQIANLDNVASTLVLQHSACLLKRDAPAPWRFQGEIIEDNRKVLFLNDQQKIISAWPGH